VDVLGRRTTLQQASGTTVGWLANAAWALDEAQQVLEASLLLSGVCPPPMLHSRDAVISRTGTTSLRELSRRTKLMQSMWRDAPPPPPLHNGTRRPASARPATSSSSTTPTPGAAPPRRPRPPGSASPRRTKASAEAKDEPTPDYKQRYGATKDLYAASSAAAMAAAASKAETRRALDRIVATHAQAHGLGGKAPITREAMEAGLRRNTIVRKASITQGDRVQLKGEEGGAADVNSR
jgi:hypothetical protein